MTDAIPILLRHLAAAERDRRFHLARHHKGNLEALIAGHKSAWLRQIIREIGGPEAMAQAEIIRRGGDSGCAKPAMPADTA